MDTMTQLAGPRLGAPWYVHPAEDPLAWQRLLAGRTGLSFAVVNPSSGPGPLDDPYYPAALAAGSSTPLLGYVNLDYGRRPLSEVLAEVRSWYQRYPVSGVMLDCTPGQAELGEWRVDVIDRIREAGASMVVANPGLPPVPELVLRADLTCVAEYDWAFFRSWTPPAYLRDLPAEKQWMLVHGVPAGEQQAALELIAQRGAGVGWATAGVLPNPWAVLPRQW